MSNWTSATGRKKRLRYRQVLPDHVHTVYILITNCRHAVIVISRHSYCRQTDRSYLILLIWSTISSEDVKLESPFWMSNRLGLRTAEADHVSN